MIKIIVSSRQRISFWAKLKKTKKKKEEKKKSTLKKCEIFQIPLMAPIIVPPVWCCHVKAVLSTPERGIKLASSDRKSASTAGVSPPETLAGNNASLGGCARSEKATPHSAAQITPGTCRLPPIRGEDKHRWRVRQSILISWLHGDELSRKLA